MKRKNHFLLLLCILALLFTGCGNYASMTQEEAEAMGVALPSEETVQTEPVQTVNRLPYMISHFDKDGEMASQITFEYDDNGQLVKTLYVRYPTTSAESSYESVTEITYDSEGRMIQKINGENAQSGFSYTYNDKGQLIQETVWEGSATVRNYEYNSDGQITRILANYDTVESIHEYYYNADGQRTSGTEVRTNLVTGEIMTQEFTFSYNDQGRLIGQNSHGDVGGEYTITHSYDDLGRPAEQIIHGTVNLVIKYDYSYLPFLVEQTVEDDTYSSTCITLEDIEENAIWQISVNEASILKDDKDRIMQINSAEDGSSYCFYYQDSDS